MLGVASTAHRQRVSVRTSKSLLARERPAASKKEEGERRKSESLGCLRDATYTATDSATRTVTVMSSDRSEMEAPVKTMAAMPRPASHTLDSVPEKMTYQPHTSREAPQDRCVLYW